MRIKKLRMRNSLVALAFVFTVGTVLPVSAPPAFAQNGLFDIIFGNQQRTRSQRQREIRRVRQNQVRQARPAPRVKGPSFYTYKPDVLKDVDLSELATVEVAVAEPVEEATQTASVQDNSQPSVAQQSDIVSQTRSSEPKVDEVEVASLDPVITEDQGLEPVVADDATNETAAADTSSFDGDSGEPLTENAETASQSPDEAEAETPVVSAADEEPVVTAFDESRSLLEGFKIRTFKEVGAALKEHYKTSTDFIWVSDDKPNDRARAALETLAAADEVGLTASDYSVVVPSDAFDTSDMEARKRELLQFEMDMSAAALSYVLDATRGRIDPNRLSGYHDFVRKDVDLVAALVELSTTDDADTYLRNANPDNRQFKMLTKELAALRKADEDDHIEIAKGTFLKVGRSSPELKNVIAAIRKRGSDALLVEYGLTFVDYDTNGGDLYTQDLVPLIKDFQRENGLAPDGIVGKMTIGKLAGVSNETKIGKLVLAMERLRWLPRDLGTRHVFINQPAFQASYIKNNKPEISMRVVVGTKANQTSFFQDEIETVEYNPYWGVPRSIIVNEMLPKLRRDPSYLDRLGYQLTDRRGRRVASRNVNWYSVGAKTVPVDVRQPPGPKNALGELKIMFPNKHAIYMHDTPAKNLFERDHRAFSHGCIRLHDPRGMAAAVLGTSREHIAQQIAQGRNMAEPVAGNIPVYVSYFTAWPKEDGSVGYYADMYDRDTHLNKAIARTRDARG